MDRIIIDLALAFTAGALWLIARRWSRSIERVERDQAARARRLRDELDRHAPWS